MPNVSNLAALRSNYWLDALRSSPAWLHFETSQGESWKTDNLDSRLARRPDLVRIIVRLGGKTADIHPVRHSFNLPEYILGKMTAALLRRELLVGRTPLSNFLP